MCKHFQFVGEEERLPWQGWPSEGQPQLVHCLLLPALPPALLVLFCSTAVLVLCKSSAIFTSALLYSARAYSCIGIQYKYTWYLSILVHHRIIEVYKKYTKNSVNSRQNSQNWSKFAKFGQHFAFPMLKSTPARKKYTTAGCGGCDKYELCL